MIEIKIKKLFEDAKLPTFAHPGDAGMDFFSREKVNIKPGERKAISTGIAMELPSGYVGLVWDKSSVGIKEGIKTLGGVLDAGYRGEILIGVVNLSDKGYVFEKHHKIAQMLIQKIERPTLVESTELSDSARGAGGFGSTGR